MPNRIAIIILANLDSVRILRQSWIGNNQSDSEFSTNQRRLHLRVQNIPCFYTASME